jgi:hypothetical protein
MGHGSYQHSYSGGGGCSGGGGASTSLSLSPSVTQQLSMHRDLSETLQSFHGTIAEAHPSHRLALAGGRAAATSGLDETTEVQYTPAAPACLPASHIPSRQARRSALLAEPLPLFGHVARSEARKPACARAGTFCSCWERARSRGNTSYRKCDGHSSMRYDAL